MLFSLRFGTVLILLALVACATKDPGFYRHEPSIPTLEVPPDLTQPVLNDSFAIPGIGAILNRKSVVSDGSEVQLMRDGRLRWLVIKSDPSYVWEKVKDYWRHAGVPVAWQNRELGIMETEWVKNYQNRFDRDQFRVRIEPAKEKNTSYLFLTHKGQNQKVMEDEVLPVWDERPTDYELETEVL
ncbi:MAG: outer membrane protein assembly factor BamC, partial [Gammaproteobacteria bacterium]|nr:outer membrane protein assembly factor BamC [Gammaproteobacteria bacterium]